MILNSNIASMMANENTTNTNNNLKKSIERFSTGLKVNKASDDASGLAIADKLKIQANGIKQGIENSMSAIAFLQIADKSMSELSNILDVVKQKSIQMATDTTPEEMRVVIKDEILKLFDSFNDIVDYTNYNGIHMIRDEENYKFQVGINSPDDVILDIENLYTSNIGTWGRTLDGFVDGSISETYINIADSLKDSPVNGLGEYVLDGIILSRKTDKDVLNLNDKIEYIEFDFVNFDVISERFTIKDDTGNVVSQVKPNTSSPYDLNNNIQELVALDTSLVDSWDYSSLYSNSFSTSVVGTMRLDNIKDDISISATGAFLILDEMRVKLKPGVTLDDFKAGSTTKPSSSSDNTNRDDTDLIGQANELMGIVDEALSKLNSVRGSIGAAQNQVESSVRNSKTSYVNLKNAESVIRDVDYTLESANFTKLNILSQAGSYAQSQSNKVASDHSNTILDMLK